MISEVKYEIYVDIAKSAARQKRINSDYELNPDEEFAIAFLSSADFRIEREDGKVKMVFDDVSILWDGERFRIGQRQ